MKKIRFSFLFTAFISLVAGLFLTLPAGAAAPSGFQKENLVSGLAAPSALEFAPDGRLFILELGGKVRVYKNGALLPNPLTEVPALVNSDRGALGITVDPDWSSTPYVYIYFIDKNDGFHKLWRVSASTDVFTGTPTEIYNSKKVSGSNHAGGGIAFGPSGKLFLGIGDSGQTHLSQDLMSHMGKVLRMEKNGDPVTDNPFYGQAGKDPLIYGYGFRNPFRISFDAATDRLLVGDVGDSTWEEVDVLEKGKNYGWPKAEGKCTANCAGLTDPIYVYKHITVNGYNTGSISGGFVYRGNELPNEYNGSYIFADFSQGHLSRVNFQSDGVTVKDNSTIIPSPEEPGITDLVQGPDGAIYYVRLTTGNVVRLSYQKAPVQSGKLKRTAVISNGLNAPTALAFAPDGRLFITEFGGDIKVYKNGQLLPDSLGKVTVAFKDEQGLLGITTDPNWDQTPYVYAYYINEKGNHTVRRFNASSDVDATGGVEIYNSNINGDRWHFGGGIAFGKDGKLYISVGDGGVSSRAQDLADIYGSVLRLNKDGSTPSDNPFVGQAGKNPNIWAYGLRNPFRFSFDPNTGALFLADVGQDNWEEINIIEKGKNYGWPKTEGMCTANCTGLTDPIYTYPHMAVGASITGGFFNSTGVLGEEFRNQYIFGDYVRGFIKSLDVHQHDGEWEAHAETLIDGDASIVVAMTPGPDGALYYVDVYGNHLYKISAAQENKPPVAKASADKTSGEPPLTVKFSSAGSNDPEGKPVTYKWNFGDGTTSTDANPTKIFTEKGVFNVMLSVSDGVYTMTTEEIVIQVSTPPTLEVTAPVNGELFSAGETFSYSAKGKDSLGNDLPASAFTTEIRFHHNTHYHPFLGPIQSQSGTFTIPTTGETADDVWYKVLVTAKDSNGLTTTNIVEIFPRKSTVQVNTVPAGLVVNIDGQPKTAPYTFVGVEGLEREFEAPAQTKDGKSYVFDSWNTGKPALHTIQTPVNDTTYTATFKEIPTVPQEGFNAEYFNGITLSGEPLLKRVDKNVDFTWNNASPGVPVPADFYSTRWVKKQNFTEGRYVFSMSTDDGSRLFIDGKLIIDDWSDHAVRTKTAELDLTEGDHEIKMEYYEAAGGAVAKLAWKRSANIPAPSPTDYTVKFWNFAKGTEPAIPSTAPVYTLNAQSIDFNWGTAEGPVPGIGKDYYVVEATAKKQFEDGTYIFDTQSDDGIRLYIDGQLLIDQWNDHGVTKFSAPKVMTAGLHEVKVQYYEKTVLAVVKLSFTKSAPTQGVFQTRCFDNYTLTGTPVLSRTDMAVNFDWGAGSIAPVVPVDSHSCSFTKTQTYAAGTKTFRVTADDGVRLFIDGEKVLDKWFDQGSTTYNIQKTLTAGVHEVKIEYYEAFGGAVLKFNEI